MKQDTGSRLKAAREGAGLSQATAAKELGWSTATISAYEQGGREPSEAAIEALATLYAVPAAVLRYGEQVLRIAAGQHVANELRKAAAVLIETAGRIDPMQDREGMDAVRPNAPAGALPAKGRRRGSG